MLLLTVTSPSLCVWTSHTCPLFAWHRGRTVDLTGSLCMYREIFFLFFTASLPYYYHRKRTATHLYNVITRVVCFFSRLFFTGILWNLVFFLLFPALDIPLKITFCVEYHRIPLTSSTVCFFRRVFLFMTRLLENCSYKPKTTLITGVFLF